MNFRFAIVGPIKLALAGFYLSTIIVGWDVPLAQTRYHHAPKSKEDRILGSTFLRRSGRGHSFDLVMIAVGLGECRRITGVPSRQL